MTANAEPFWVRVPDTLIGIGAVQNTGTLVKKLAAKKVLIVTDRGVAQAGLVDKVKRSLEEEGIELGIFDACEPDAPVNVIKSCAQFAKEGGYDLMISVGGGSTMDIAKVAAVVATAEDVAQEDINQYVPTKVPRRGLPKIHVPTTAGTGSEVSIAAVITDTDGRKKAILSEYFFPEVAIVDPLMTLNLPPRITADSGMDALSHAIEAYTTVKASIVSDMFAEMTMKLVADNLRTAYSKGSENLEARYNMAIAAHHSSIALSTAGGAILSHGMGYAIQMGIDCTHGVSCSIMLPHVMEFNMLTDQPRYAHMAELMGEKVEGLSLPDAAQKAADAVRQLSLDVNMPQRLRDIGVKKEQIPQLVDILFTYSPRHVSNNPHNCSREDAARIFEAAW